MPFSTRAFHPVHSLPVECQELGRVATHGAAGAAVTAEVDQTLAVAAGRVVEERTQIAHLAGQIAGLLLLLVTDSVGRVLVTVGKPAWHLEEHLAHRRPKFPLQQHPVLFIQQQHADTRRAVAAPMPRLLPVTMITCSLAWPAFAAESHSFAAAPV